jgi:polyisoprenoid-binding protein YceI
VNARPSRPRRLAPWVIAAVVIVPLVLFAGAYLLFFNEDSPDELTLSAPPATEGGATTPPEAGSGGSAPLAGTWNVAPGSIAGYRVREKLAALPASSDAVGRTESVSGTVTVRQSGAQLVADGVNVEVDVSTLRSDENRRDSRIRTSGLQTDEYPTATFVSTAPVTLPAGTEAGQAVTADITGDMTIHGVTRRVTIPLEVRLTGAEGEVVGKLTFPFSDFGMSPPNVGGFVSVENDATLEFKLLLARG